MKERRRGGKKGGQEKWKGRKGGSKGEREKDFSPSIPSLSIPLLKLWILDKLNHLQFNKSDDLSFSWFFAQATPFAYDPLVLTHSMEYLLLLLQNLPQMYLFLGKSSLMHHKMHL